MFSFFHRDCALIAGIQPAVRGLHREMVGVSSTTLTSIPLRHAALTNGASPRTPLAHNTTTIVQSFARPEPATWTKGGAHKSELQAGDSPTCLLIASGHRAPRSDTLPATLGLPDPLATSPKVDDTCPVDARHLAKGGSVWIRTSTGASPAETPDPCHWPSAPV